MSEKAQESKRLSSFGGIHAGDETLPIDEVEGLELEIKDFTLQKGDFGVYAFIYAKDPNGQEITVRTGAKLIIAALQDAKKQDALPVLATFKKRGLAWICE
jgi:hypothetical protein